MQEWIRTELDGLYGDAVLREFGEIIRLYEFYDGKGQRWTSNQALDYTPTVTCVNWVKKLIKAQARFLFGRTPEFFIQAPLTGQDDAAAQVSAFVSGVMTENRLGDKLIRAARDCFIGKRVAIKLWTEEGALRFSFRPSTEFVFEMQQDDAEKLQKIIFFYGINDESKPEKKRIFRQKFELRDGKCLLSEGIFDGRGNCVEKRWEDYDTGLSFIPAYVIINDGLCGDCTGESDVKELMNLQNSYNRLCSDDLDALRFNMFPQRIAVDAAPASLERLVIAPGALIDLQTDPTLLGTAQASMEMLEPKFSYDERLEHTLNRIKSDMHGLLSIPNVAVEQLSGTLSSGQSIRCLYWELICRCEEKWTVWEAALRWLCEKIISLGADAGTIPEEADAFAVRIEHSYPLPGDDESEREHDLEEVREKVRSRQSYMDKWGIAANTRSELDRIDADAGMTEGSKK